jgi:hypothetical protein
MFSGCHRFGRQVLGCSVEEYDGHANRVGAPKKSMGAEGQIDCLSAPGLSVEFRS